MKKVLFLTLLVMSLFAVSAQPSFAAENASGNIFQNFFQKVQTTVSNTAQRVFLMLPGDKPGSVVLNQAAQAATQIKTEEVAADVSVNIQSEDQSLANIKVHVDGPIEINDQKDQQLHQDLHLTGVFSMQGTSMQADANLKMADKKIYFKLNEVPVLPYIDVSDLKGKWLSVDTTNASKKTSASTTAWTEEQKHAFQQANTDLLKKSQISSAKKEKKDDHQVYVVDVTLPKDALIAYAEAVQKIQAQSQTESDEPRDVASSQETLHTILQGVDEIKTTLWVDRGTFFIRHVELPLVYTKPADTAELPVDRTNPLANLAKFQTLKISIMMTFDKFNVPLKFEEPTDAEDAQQAFQKIMGGSATGAGMPSGINPSELPSLTPQQKMQLEQFNKMQQLPGQ
jgi:hypothetical protein